METRQDLGFLDRVTPTIPQMDRFRSKFGPNWPYFGPLERDYKVNSRCDEIIENGERLGKMKSTAGILKHSENLKAQVVLRKAHLALRKTQPRKCKEGAPQRCRNDEIELQTDENGLGTDEAGLENAENG